MTVALSIFVVAGFGLLAWQLHVADTRIDHLTRLLDDAHRAGAEFPVATVERVTEALGNAMRVAAESIAGPAIIPAEDPNAPLPAARTMATWAGETVEQEFDSWDPTDATMPDPAVFRPEVALLGETGDMGVEGLKLRRPEGWLVDGTMP